MDFLQITNFRDLSSFLDYEPYKLGYLLYKVNRKHMYNEFSIPKKSGDFRTIYAPNLQLRTIQGKIKNELEKYYKPHSHAHGFISGKSILTNSKKHLEKKWLVNIDLKDFFPSITAKRIYGLFQSKPFSFNKQVASYLASILTYNNQLPQGAVTSPIISNMICLAIDKRLSSYCERHDITYTRYADDITFSSHNQSSLQKVYRRENNNVSHEIKQIIRKNGFEVNENKIRCNYYFKHQEVTGIKTNKQPNIKSFQKYRIRSMLHAWQKYGIEKATNEYMQKRNLVGDNKNYTQAYINELSGLIAYSKMILGKDNYFYQQSAHKFNCLYKKNKFYVEYPADVVIQHSLFTLIYEANEDISQLVCFFAQGLFFTNLHGLFDEKEIIKLKTYAVNISLMVSERLKKSYLENVDFSEKTKILLNNAIVDFISLDYDLIVFKIPDFFSPFNLSLSTNNIDDGKTYTLASVETSSYKMFSANCTLTKQKMIGNGSGYAISTIIEEGMSGSPILEFNSTRVCGYVVYGYKKDPNFTPSYKNGIYGLNDSYKIKP